MRLLHLLWITVLAIQSGAFANDEIVRRAKEYRVNSFLPAEAEEVRQKKILDQAFASLKSYDDQSSLEGAVREFLSDQFPKTSYNYDLVNASLTDVGGKSQDPVFLVKDASQTLCFVIKAFKNPRELSGKFLPEISALELIEQLNLPGIMPIRPIAFASFRDQGQEWGLLLETAAKGERVDQFIFQLAALKPDSEERKAFLEVCKNVFRKAGESFAALHAIKSQEVYPLKAIDLEKYSTKIAKILNSPFIVQELEKNIPIDTFLEYLEKIRSDILDVSFRYSFWHGDAHLGNMFYDVREDSFYFIDVAKMHHSVTNTLQPLADGTIDLIRVEENLRRISLGRISDEEMAAILNSFYETYEACSKEKPNKKTLLFHKTSKKLGRLIDYARYVERQNPILKEVEKAVFEDAIRYFSCHQPFQGVAKISSESFLLSLRTNLFLALSSQSFAYLLPRSSSRLS